MADANRRHALIEPLVVGIEGWDGEVYDFHFSNSRVTDAGWDENCAHWADGHQLTRELPPGNF